MKPAVAKNDPQHDRATPRQMHRRGPAMRLRAVRRRRGDRRQLDGAGRSRTRTRKGRGDLDVSTPCDQLVQRSLPGRDSARTRLGLGGQVLRFVEVHCRGSLSRFIVEVHCRGSLSRFIVEVHCRGSAVRRVSLASQRVQPWRTVCEPVGFRTRDAAVGKAGLGFGRRSDMPRKACQIEPCRVRGVMTVSNVERS